MAASASSHSIRSCSSPSVLSKALFLRHCFHLLQEPVIVHFSSSTLCSRQSPWACSGRTQYIQRRAGCQARRQARALRSHRVSRGPGNCCRTSGRGGRERSSFSCVFLFLFVQAEKPAFHFWLRVLAALAHKLVVVLRILLCKGINGVHNVADFLFQVLPALF